MTESLFMKDMKGDKQNVVYGQPNQYSTPKFRNVGRGFLLGLTRDSRLSKPGGDGRRVVTNGTDSSQRRYHHLLKAAVPREQERLLANTSENQVDGIGSQLDYVNITSDRQRKRRRLCANAVVEQTACLEGIENDSSPSDEDGVSSSDNDADNAYQSFRIDPVQARQRRLRDDTKQDPNNVDAWLALAEIQEDLVIEQHGNQAKGTSHRRLLSNLRLSIFEEALAQVKTPASQVQLTESFMKEGANLWDHGKQRAQWQKLLQGTASFELRMLYLNFLQSDCRHFSIETIIAAYQEALRLSNTVVRGREQRDENCLYLILRLTYFLRQSGFIERAVAIWQALIEFNLFRPLSWKPDEDLSSFEDFWESEAVRVGEPGALGWSGTHAQRTPCDDQQPPALDRTNLLTSWCAVEQSQSAQNCLPARTFDTANEDDPYRVILFDDIRGFVLKLSSERGNSLLLAAFLCFVGLPVPNTVATSARWVSDPYLADACASSGTKLPFKGVPDCMSFFEYQGSVFTAIRNSLYSSLLESWVSRTVKLLATFRPHDTYFGELCVALEAPTDVVSARKFAKRLLKQTPGSYRLYNAYALLEARFGNFEGGEKVWSATLASHKHGRMILDSETACLWHTWIWACVRRGDIRKAHEVFKRIDIGHTTSPETYPDLRQVLEMAMNKARIDQEIESMVLIFDLLALLEYLSNDQDLWKALGKLSIFHTSCVYHKPKQLRSNSIPTGTRASSPV